MNLGFLYFIVAIMFFGLVGLLVWFLSINYKEKEEPNNADIYVNLNNRFTSGYGLFIKRNEKVIEGRNRVEAMPRDIDYIKAKNDKNYKIGQENIIFYDNYRVPLSNSTHRKIYLILPHKIEFMPEELRNHPFGKKIAEYIVDQNNVDEENDIFQRRLKNQKKMLDKYSGQDILETYDYLNQDVIKRFQNSNPINNIRTEKKDE